MSAKYGQAIDRAFAYEVLAGRAAVPAEEYGRGFMGGLNDILFGATGPRGGKHDGVAQTMVKSTVRSIARELVRGILGSLSGSKPRRRVSYFYPIDELLSIGLMFLYRVAARECIDAISVVVQWAPAAASAAPPPCPALADFGRANQTSPVSIRKMMAEA